MNAHVTPDALRSAGHMPPDTGALTAWREDLAAELEPLAHPARRIMMEAAVVNSGGMWIAPGKTNWGPHFAELSVGGVHASGNDLDECIAAWIKAVLRAARAAAEVAA
ncbi:hypothetical protein [Roseivivax isoporae]|uniref:Uncharacterized protein n=1 Tax=Roseivivax isoporae LMG 25204 TaxID=1449351 RepID=X7F3K1_9RHOB|nr:hypothetical protein [Roseivivax isoporae]ETX26614.1 hypothetical protein RISW2_21710 [Roseivivax isoporae LMG 25204]